MASFLTVKEASALTGKSPSSIRRILYAIIHEDAHQDRAQIEPSVEDVMKLRVKGENFAWRLSEELLRREISPETRPEKGSESTPGRFQHDAQAALIAMLQGELDIKNTQITQQAEFMGKQLELVTGLSERVREGNILIASLQQRLALADGRPPVTPIDNIETKVPPSAPSKKGSSIPPKPPKPKRGILSRFFR